MPRGAILSRLSESSHVYLVSQQAELMQNIQFAQTPTHGREVCCPAVHDALQ